MTVSPFKTEQNVSVSHRMTIAVNQRRFGNRKSPMLLMWWYVAGFAMRVIAADITAEDAWKDLLIATENFEAMEPSSLQKEKFDRFLAKYSREAGALADRFKDYQRRYTNSPHLDEAWDQWMDLLNVAANGNLARKAELEKAEQQCLSDPKLERSRRESIRRNQIDRLADLKERERLVREVKHEFETPILFFCERILTLAEFSEYPHSRELVEEVLKLTENKQTLRHHYDQALELKERLDRIGKPLELKFTALDGTEVDIQKLRGKVVLLEFWATWCPPCVAGIPQIKSAWTALHKDGFEVIALSYDTKRETLAKFVRKNALPWPQFFAPEGNEAPLIKGFGQPGPPAYWLVDRDGVLVDINAHDKLLQKVKIHLARKNSASADSHSRE